VTFIGVRFPANQPRLLRIFNNQTEQKLNHFKRLIMSKVTIKILPSSVIFSQGKREVTLSKKHLPLISGVISATSSRGLAPMGIARKKEFTSLAIPAGYKGRNSLLDCAKDSAEFAVSKGLLQKKGMIYEGCDATRHIAEKIVYFVKDSDDFKTASAKVAKSGGLSTGKKASKFKKFRIDEDQNLVRLSRGKPSVFWTIVQAPEGSNGINLEKAKNLKDFKVLQKAGEKSEKVVRKSAKSKGISTEEVAAMVTAQVAEIVKDLPVGKATVDMTEVLEMLTIIQNELLATRQLCNLLKQKADFQSAEIVKLSSKLDKPQASKPVKSQKAKDSKHLTVTNEDLQKAKEDAKLAAMADISSISEEFANIVTKL
tara:strand:- start:2029 stop:3138 length:1110 start_codon:yes stop_codon:yes gene_type:complete